MRQMSYSEPRSRSLRGPGCRAGAIQGGGYYFPGPVSDTCWGEPVALCAMFRAAARVPLAVGLKITETVQLEPTARLAVQVVDLL